MAKPSNLNRRELFLAAGATTLAAGLTTTVCSAAVPTALPQAKPADIGLNSKQLQVAYDLLEKWTTGPDAPVPGGAILVGRNGKTVAPQFFGKHGSEKNARAVRNDSLFLMASITKPMTYIAALQLVERGHLNLSDPVSLHIPQFKGAGKEAVLVSHLFTHTSGLPDMPPGNAELRQSKSPFEKFVTAAIRDTELLFKPGTQVSYQSCGTILVAEIVQHITGKSIDDVVRREIFEPLGLKSTAFGAKGFERDRIVRVQTQDYQVAKDWDWNSPYWQDLGVPWGGMFSTPEDFAVICQMLLAKGEWGGVRILAPATVRAMTTNRLMEYPDLPEAVARTQPWGLGWRLNHPGTTDSWGDLLGKNVFGHTGSTGTMVWMDPDTKGFCILLTSALRAKAPWRLVRLSNAVAAAFEV